MDTYSTDNPCQQRLKEEWVDRETVNRDVGVGRGKWVNKHTKRRRGWFSFPENEWNPSPPGGLWVNSFTHWEAWRGGGREGGKGEVRRIFPIFPVNDKLLSVVPTSSSSSSPLSAAAAVLFSPALSAGQSESVGMWSCFKCQHLNSNRD